MIDRPEDEKNEGEEAHRVHPERQRCDRLTGPLREPMGLPGVEQVSRDERDRNAGQDAAHHKRLRQTRDERAQAHDNDELAQIVDEESKEPVDVVRHKPSSQECPWCGCRIGGHMIPPCLAAESFLVEPGILTLSLPWHFRYYTPLCRFPHRTRNSTNRNWL